MSEHLERQAEEKQPPERIADRYEVHELLGRGGMARVYRVTDLVTGHEVALKQLVLPEQIEQRAGVAALFEREFHTLAQLCHPRVIAVYDYGVNVEAGPHYTMELLDGGDLRDRAPLPWRDACKLLFDVCSSLALLHSRRLLHRDISPRNIRCTRDGEAKLIDFGAMTPMGAGGSQIVGTPAFTPPESLHRSALDARADLFSLGATMYYALTGSMGYPARSFAEALAAWNTPPLPPSARAKGIPAALDDLVMSLLSVEPELRPRTAFEVMQRLAAIAGLPCSEPEGVSRAYLSTPVLVGREATLATLGEKLTPALNRHGGGVIVRAAPGLGRSRILDACALAAKTLGFTVLRAKASGAQDGFGVALGLTQDLLEALPSGAFAEHFPQLFERQALPRADENLEHPVRMEWKLKNLAALRADPEKLQRSICRFMLTVSTTHPLVVAVDDVHSIDEPSAAVLASLVDKAGRANLLVALTVEGGGLQSTVAVDVLTRRCEILSLEPLSRAQTRALFGSVFGDVTNLELVADEIHKIARGNPRQSIDVAQHLVDKHSIEYAAGTWTLPSRLSAADLPSSAEEAIRVRIEALQPLARFIAEAQALAFHEVFIHAHYHALCPDMDSSAVDAAISELLAQQALASDGQAYSLANRVWTAAFKAGLGSTESQQRHRALAELYRGRSNPARIHHLFAAGLDEQGLDALIERHAEYAEHFDLKAVLELDAINMGPSYERAIATARRLGRPARQVNELRRWLVALSVATDPSYYWRAAPAWLAQLEHDSGLALWKQDAQTADAGERIIRALQRANERYLATPEAERVYRVDEAIRFLAQYVAFSIAIGARTMDATLGSTLPELLEPFAPLSPVIAAIWQNAIATREAQRDCQYERARTRWMDVHEKLGQISGAELQHVELIRNAVAYAVGMAEASLGLASATSWAERLDQDPLQKLSAMYLRKVVRLEQGDWNGADRLRRQAEVFALQARSPQMFTTLLAIELTAHAHARDLGGVKEVMERIEPLAARHPGWRPFLRLAQARFELIRGDLAAAKHGFERCIELATPGSDRKSRSMAVWISAHAGLSEALLALDCAEQARVYARFALARCDELQIEAQAYDLTRALALAEARLGDFDSAIARLDALIQKQTALGVSGLKLGLSYETRAQIAIEGDDEGAFEQYARLTAREYRYGDRCPLSTRYERLVNEARRRGFNPVADLIKLGPNALAESTGITTNELATAVTQAMARAQRTEERSLEALRLICDERAARGGHFYLVRPAGLVLSASHGLEPPSTGLSELVSAYLAREQDSSEMLTLVAKDARADDRSEVSSTAEVDGITYQLLLVACTVGNTGKVAGVIAIAAGGQHVQSAKQGQLLAMIAAHLVRAGDGSGMACER